MNFWRSFAPRAAFALAAAVGIWGCGPGDGLEELKRGEEAYAAGDYMHADKFLEEALEVRPQCLETLVAAGRVKLALGEIGAARSLADRAEAACPGAPEAVNLRGQAAFRAQDYDTAVASFKALGESAELDVTNRAVAYASLGAVEMARNAAVKARVSLLKAVQLDRRNAAARYHLGLLYRDNYGYPEAALAQFEFYVRLEQAASPRMLSVQRSAIPELTDMIARTAAQRPGVARRDSSAAKAEFDKAEAAAKKGAWKDAVKRYEAAVKADPLSYPAALGLAKARLKLDSTLAGRKLALESYRNACSLKPDLPSVHLTAAALAVEVGRHQTAVELYSRALAVAPTDITAIDGLIRALRKSGKAADAAEYQAYRDWLGTFKRRR